MEHLTYHQQGDVLFKKVDKKPIGTKALKGNVIVQGSHGGNAHSIVNGAFKILIGKDKKNYLEVIKPVDAVHPEHKTIKLPKGVYLIDRVMEYDHMTEESKEVID